MLTIYAFLPILVLIILLTGFKKPAVFVAPFCLLVSVLLAFFIWKQPPTLLMLAGLEGIVYGMWPIGIIIFGAVCLSNLMIKSGAVKEIETLIGTVSTDIRINVVLVGWGLESFLEAIAGFGSGLVLPFSILRAMGVSSLKAGVIVLLANSVPTAYGGVGIGLMAMSNASGVPLEDITNYLSWQLLLPALFMPFIIVRTVTNSWKEVREIFWVPLFSGLGQGFALMLPLSVPVVTILSGLFNIGGGVLATNLFYPHLKSGQQINTKQTLHSLFPFLMAILLLLGVPLIADKFISTEISIYPESTPLVFNWLTDAGILLLFSGIVGGRTQGLSFKTIFQVALDTLKQLNKTMLVLMSILAMARVMTYSGMIDVLARGFTQYLGSVYPIFAPVLGTIGVFVTGSVTSSGILLGSLQAEMGRLLDIPSAWLVAMNASGATAGKMLDPYSIMVVITAIGSSKEESAIISIVSKSLIFYVLVLMALSSIAYFI